MGNEQSKAIGPRSLRSETLELSDEEIDYKDVKNASKAKKELYALFIDDKLTHVSKLEELTTQLDKIEEENKSLREQLDKYKQFNTVNTTESSTPVNPPSEITELPSQDVDTNLNGSSHTNMARLSRIADKIKAAQKRLRRSES